jgi:hypothetical protein
MIEICSIFLLIQRMKKFGRNGQFGRGNQIDKDTYDYFVKVMDTNRQGFDGDDDAKGQYTKVKVQ